MTEFRGKVFFTAKSSLLYLAFVTLKYTSCRQLLSLSSESLSLSCSPASVCRYQWKMCLLQSVVNTINFKVSYYHCQVAITIVYTCYCQLLSLSSQSLSLSSLPASVCRYHWKMWLLQSVIITGRLLLLLYILASVSRYHCLASRYHCLVSRYHCLVSHYHCKVYLLQSVAITLKFACFSQSLSLSSLRASVSRNHCQVLYGKS